MNFEVMTTPEFWLTAVMGLVVVILSLAVHEYAHARVAYALGDDTAARDGRMTLSPLSHIDPIGTILMPILGAATAGFSLIGWARPVPVNPVRLTRRFSMRSGHALVAAAGPASNFLLSLLAVALLRLTVFSGLLDGTEAREPLAALLYQLFYSNLGLAAFNLLPIPPLDGSRLMPRSLDSVMETVQRYSFLLFMLVIMFGGRIVAIPVALLGGLLTALFGVPNLTR